MITKEDQDLTAKQEGNTSEIQVISKPASTTSASWTRLKDPRIVRVSRAFGGKDRHSKVCTVRGLRDRRVRLSVPTAIQLYDLQDRLGLNQPSKVVEWLLKAAKHGIDELPPLQLPPGNFPQNLYPMSSAKSLIKTNSSINWDDPLVQSTLNAIDSDESLGDKSKEITEETNDNDKDQNWGRNGEEKGSNLEDHGPYLASNSNHFFPSSLMNNSMSYNSFQRWDHSNLSLSHDGGSHGLTSQPEEFHNFNVASGSQVVYPAGLMQSYFINSQILSSSSQNSMSHSITQPVEDSNQSVRPFHFSMMTDKDNDFHSR